ncbi:MAG: large repetitive protein [Frankiaceae bacterium]|nr:large repetitive protein [Frankiaceae bacterium]
MTGVRVPSPLRLASGSTVLLPVEIVNDSDAVLEFVVSTVGLDPSWARHRAGCGPLAPGDVAIAELTVSVPAGSPAGTFPFLVSVQSLHSVDGSPAADPIEVDCSVVVGDASRLKVELEPREPAGVHGRRFKVLFENNTPDDLVVSMDAHGAHGLELLHNERPVPVGAGAFVRVKVRARVRRRLFGHPRRMPFVVSVQGETTPVRTNGVFVAKPLFSTALTKVVAVVAILGMWLAVSRMGLNLISANAHKPKGGVTAGADGNGAGGNGTGGNGTGGNGTGGQDGGAGSGGAGGAGGGGGSTSAQTASSRLNGVVTGKSPGGVRVTLAPTSLVDEAAEGASFPTGVAPASTGKIAATLISYARPAAVSATRSTVTRPDGSWAFAGLAKTGYYMLTFAKAGFQTKRFVVSQDTSTGAPLKVPLVAGAGRLSGAVRTAAGAVGGATVVITDGSVTVTTTTPTKGTVGQWSVDGLSTPGAYLVTAGAQGLATASRLVTLAAGGSTAGVDLTLQRGLQSLTGKVDQATDTGTSAGGVTVTATDGTNTRTATTVSRESTGGVSALEGTFTLPDLPLGTYTVTYAAPGYATRTQRVTLTGNASRLALPFTHLSQAGASVAGTVTDPHGGLVGAGLVLTGPSATYKLTTAADGSYAFTGVTPGSYVLSAEKFQHVTSFGSVDAVAGKTKTLNLVLQEIADTGLPTTGFIRGRVVDARNGGLITCPAATPACISVGVTGVAGTIPVTPGAEYVLPHSGPGLTPGLHTVTVSAPGYETASIKVQVPVGGTAIAPVVALQPRAALTGKITPGAAAPLPATCVVAVPFDGTTIPTVTSCSPLPDLACSVIPADPGARCAQVDVSGNYTVGDLPRSGAFFVFVRPVSDAEWIPVPGTPLTLALGETRRYDATMSRAGRIHALLRVPAAVSGLESPSQTVDVTATPVNPTTHLPLGSPAPVTVHSGPNFGEALVTGLAGGTYRLSAAGTPTGATSFSGFVDIVEAGTNQTAETTVVMTDDVPNSFVGRVVWTQNTQTFGIPNAQVVVRGVRGFTGTAEVPGSVTVTTDANGCYGVTHNGSAAGLPPTAECPGLTGANVGQLVLATPRITIDADATQDYVAHTARGFGSVRFSTSLVGAGSVTAVVSAPDLVFTGAVTTTGGSPPDLSHAQITVTTAALGSGTIVVEPDASGVLTWRDSVTGNAVNRVHAGTYQLTVSMPGFDDDSATLDCLLDADGNPAVPATPCDITLRLGTHVQLTVDVEDVDHNAVTTGVVVTLSGGNIATTTVTVPPGSATAVFNDLSAAAGTYSIGVRAPGFARANAVPVTLTSGTGATSTVVLTRLGTIRGVVSGAIGSQTAPLAGVTVTATHGLDVFTGISAADGSYAITGTAARDGLPLDTDPWTVSAAPPVGSGYSDTGAGTTTVTFPASATTVEADKVLAGTNLALSADAVALRVTVRDDSIGGGALVTDATVVVTDGAGTAHPAAAVVGAPGVYLVSGLNPTVHTLTVTAPNRAPLTTSVSLQPSVAVTNITVILADRRNAIAAHVLGQTGAAPPTPLGNASVAITRSGNPVAGSPFLANANGDVQVGALDDGTYHLVISGPAGSDYTSVTRDIALASGQLAAVEATLQRVLVSLTVNAVSASGDSLAGALVSLVATGGGAVSQAPQLAVVSGPDVSTVFNQVVPGNYRITTSGPNGHLAGSSLVTVAATPTAVTQTVTVAEAKLNLTLTATPPPATPNATVTITPEAGGAVVTQAQSADGSSHVFYVPTGSYTITAAAPGYSSTPVTGSSGGDVTIPLAKSQTGTVTVSVTEDGSPLANATVTVSGSGSVFTTGPAASSVVVGGLAPGSHDVTVMTPDGQTQTFPATVVADANVNRAFAFTTPPAQPTGTLTVTVNRSGSPVPGATVTITAQPAALSTNGSGQVTFSGLVPGTYAVTASKDGDSVTQNTTTVAAPNALTIALPPADAAVTVTVKEGTVVVSGATVVAQSSGGSATGTTNASGVVTLTGLPAGSYSITATTVDGRSGTTAGVTLTAGSTAAANVAVTASTGRFDVTVLRAGNPQSGATVSLTGPASPSANTDANGKHSFVSLPPGDYTINVTFGAFSGSATITVVAGGTIAKTITIS